MSAEAQRLAVPFEMYASFNSIAGWEVMMDETDFEGTLVLERLAAVGMLEDFFEAVDADDVGRATRLMRGANVDAATIAVVVRKMEESDGEH